MSPSAVPAPTAHNSSFATCIPVEPALVSLEEELRLLVNGRKLSNDASSLAFEYLNDQGFGALVSGASELSGRLAGSGFAVQTEVFTSKEFGHPVVVLTVRSSGGEYGVPNINLLNDPAPPIERSGSGRDPKQKLVITGESESVSPGHDELGVESFEVERFSGTVKLIILESGKAEPSFTVRPLFSREAFQEACQHASDSLQQGGSPYSYLLDEMIQGAVRENIRTEQGNHFIGERQRLDIVGGKLEKDESEFTFQITTAVPDPRLDTANVYQHTLMLRREGLNTKVVLLDS